MSNFRDMEIVDILSGSVNSNLVVNLKTPDRWRVKRSNTNNTNITQTSTSFNKFRPSEKSKTDSKITESQNSILKYLVQYSQVTQNPKKSKRNCLFFFITVFAIFLIVITADFHIQIGQYSVFLACYSVCNFQSMKRPVELNSLSSRVFCYITWFVISPA